MPPAKLKLLTLLLLLATPLALSACVGMGATQRVLDHSTPLTANARLTLPQAPDYPRTETLIQTVIGQYEDRRTAFQAVLELSPERVRIVLTAASGPRIMSIDWTDEGITIDRAAIAPDEVSGLEILGDIFLTLWPHEQVADTLPSDLFMSDAGATRSISSLDGRIVQIIHGETDAGARRTTLENHAFGYKLTIITEPAGQP